MGKSGRKVPGLNQSSTADISFILLIFFLVTTSMDTDSGLSRRLPDWDPDAVDQKLEIKERNVMTVQVNKLIAVITPEERETFKNIVEKFYKELFQQQ